LPGVIGVIQATETIKLIVEKGEPLIGRLLMYDSLAMRFREIRIRRDPDCPLCGANPTITELLNYEEFCGLEVAESAAVGT
jgi:sulfur-carrier protein adenylyltransferase/sulfurtransferase